MRYSRLVGLMVLALPLLAHGADVRTVRQMSLQIALDIADTAMKACFDKGYPVSVVVVDRAANPLVVLRAPQASRFAIDIARGKANAVILGGVSTARFRRNRSDIRDELNLLDGILILDGGLPIRVAGSLLGAVGVSGAPGGEKDEACAAKALEAVQERLEFAD